MFRWYSADLPSLLVFPKGTSINYVTRPPPPSPGGGDLEPRVTRDAPGCVCVWDSERDAVVKTAQIGRAAKNSGFSWFKMCFLF
jgi:hypothetical protein